MHALWFVFSRGEHTFPFRRGPRCTPSQVAHRGLSKRNAFVGDSIALENALNETVRRPYGRRISALCTRGGASEREQHDCKGFMGRIVRCVVERSIQRLIGFLLRFDDLRELLQGHPAARRHDADRSPENVERVERVAFHQDCIGFHADPQLTEARRTGYLLRDEFAWCSRGGDQRLVVCKACVRKARRSWWSE